jgi:FKBP-type peptidyl-prolyl cis-trans isomerase SlyD
MEVPLNSDKNPRVFSINYVLKDDKGQVLDASEVDQPFLFLEGAGQIIPALEERVGKMDIGARLEVKLAPDQAYGNYEEDLVVEVPKSQIGNIKYQVGTLLRVEREGHMSVVKVVEIKDDTVSLDGNHPLAGQPLNFDVELIAVREATKDEVSHGHAHGAGGHHHG